MGGQQAQEVLNAVKGNDDNYLLEKFEAEGSAYYSTSRLWDDGIIDPLDTRAVAGLAISIALSKKNTPNQFGAAQF